MREARGGGGGDGAMGYSTLKNTVASFVGVCCGNGTTLVTVKTQHRIPRSGIGVLGGYFQRTQPPHASTTTMVLCKLIITASSSQFDMFAFYDDRLARPYTTPFVPRNRTLAPCAPSLQNAVYVCGGDVYPRAPPSRCTCRCRSHGWCTLTGTPWPTEQRFRR